MAEDPVRETRLVQVLDREVEVQMPEEAQLILMARESRILQRDGIDGARKVAGAARLFDVLESMVVHEEDREWMTDLIATGAVDLKGLTGFMAAFKPEDEKPRVRRGRPPTKRS